MEFQTEREKWIAIAWFMAGEGTITLGSVTRYNKQICLTPRIRCVNTEKQLIDTFYELVGKVGHLYITHKERKKPIYQWELKGLANVKPFILKLQPFMPSKTRQIDILLEFYKLREGKKPNRHFKYGPEEFKLVEEMRMLALKPSWEGSHAEKWKFLDRWYYGHNNVQR